MTDCFYTPPNLADKLIKYVKLSHVNTVADFCVGNGELLRAAGRRWEKARCFAADISEPILNDVKINHPNWITGKCNFLDNSSRCHCKVLNNNKKFDLILLNPPFSCVGSKRYLVNFDDIMYYCSTSMAFIVESIKYLKKSGGLYAILPCSVAYSEKDKKIWDKLVNDYKLKVLGESQKKYFEKCSPNIILISINVDGHSCKLTKTIKITHNIKNIFILRGQISMDTINENIAGETLLVHSTNLQKNKLVDMNIKLNKPFQKISGPAVLIPRVGKPNVEKICILDSTKNVFLSDCIIAIKTKSLKDALQLQAIIIRSWKAFQTLYHGTGARYITIARLKESLGCRGTTSSGQG